MKIKPKINEGFVYLHTNINQEHPNFNKKYIGIKSFYNSKNKETNWKTYIGSHNKELLSDFKVLGWKGFKRKYLFVGDINKVKRKEVEFHQRYDVANNEEFYNNAKQMIDTFSTLGRKINSKERKKRSQKMSTYVHIYHKQTGQRKMICKTQLHLYKDWLRGRPQNKERIWINNPLTQEEKYIFKKQIRDFKEWKLGRNIRNKAIILNNTKKGCYKPKKQYSKKYSFTSHNNKPFYVKNDILRVPKTYCYNLANGKQIMNLSIYYTQKVYKGERINGWKKC